jgi:hypothetical protein
MTLDSWKRAPVRRRAEWAVRYRRRGWRQRQVRFFQSEPAARRFVERLLAWPDPRPMLELTIERRPTGPWSVIDDLGAF